MKRKKMITKIVDGVAYNESGDALFLEENKKDYTILVPTMLPIHFGLVEKMFETFGYKVEILTGTDKSIAETGLKYVHNDTCYPATLVIGQLMQAVLSGKYDTHKLALVISQTGGGCRASNYLYLLKKALKKAGFGYIPVLSFNFNGLATQPGFTFTVPQFYGLLKCVLYGDLLMALKNQCEPYEKTQGETQSLVDFWIEKLGNEFKDKKNLKYSHMKSNYDSIVRSFQKIELDKTVKKPKVGIVGEIFVKYSPLGNNDLEKFLVREGAEIVVPGLTDFVLYCIINNVIDTKIYGIFKIKGFVSKFIYKFILNKEKDIYGYMEQAGFRAPASFDKTLEMRDGYINEGVKMGEGWLLTAEMVELIHSGADNIVCAQPFGCLPNHIVGKGMMKKLREKNPTANIVAIDYDASASRVNQENRIKLMLSNAKEKME